MELWILKIGCFFFSKTRFFVILTFWNWSRTSATELKKCNMSFCVSLYRWHFSPIPLITTYQQGVQKLLARKFFFQYNFRIKLLGKLLTFSLSNGFTPSYAPNFRMIDQGFWWISKVKNSDQNLLSSSFILQIQKFRILFRTFSFFIYVFTFFKLHFLKLLRQLFHFIFNIWINIMNDFFSSS